MSKRKDPPRNVLGSGFDLVDGEWVRDEQIIDVAAPGDYGADPLGEIDGEFRWKMVPSGDIVGREEMRRRLDARK